MIEQELPKDPLLRDRITCEAIRWDDSIAPTPMPATLTPQEAVNRGLAKPSECDAVIVILWSRLGTPLRDPKKPDGSPYLSGTEWEYEDAMAEKPPPHILLYRRKTKVLLDPDDPTFEKKAEQRQRMKEFFERFRNPDGSLKGGFAEYDTPQEFRDRLRHDLLAFIERKRKERQLPESRSRIKPPPPYPDIAKALSSGQVVPIIGADASYSGRSADIRWNPHAPEFLPSALELSHFLAEDTGFPSKEERDQLAEVASYYEAFQTRTSLRTRLRQILGPDALAGVAIPSLYRFLAEVPRPLLIITANYDTQLEHAFHAVQKPYDLVVYAADRKDLANTVLWWSAGSPGQPWSTRRSKVKPR